MICCQCAALVEFRFVAFEYGDFHGHRFPGGARHVDVTWLLKPVVVMAHLLGGRATFALLTSWPGGDAQTSRWCRARAEIAPTAVDRTGVLVLQIALGGWTSSNYAALAAAMNFPSAWRMVAAHDFREASCWCAPSRRYEGGVLDGPARVAIQLAHRGWRVGVRASAHGRHPMIRTPGLCTGASCSWCCCARRSAGHWQRDAGPAVVVATAHTAGAAALLFVIVGMLARLRAPE